MQKRIANCFFCVLRRSSQLTSSQPANFDRNHVDSSPSHSRETGRVRGPLHHLQQLGAHFLSGKLEEAIRALSEPQKDVRFAVEQIDARRV